MTKKLTAAQQLGFRPLRYEFGLYPTKEQEEILLRQAAMCRALQNALNVIIEQRYLRKIGDEKAITPYLLHPNAVDVEEAHEHPRSKEMSKWVKGLRGYYPAWREMSVFSPHRIVDTVERSWSAFFRNLKTDPERAGKPRRKKTDDIWIPHIHKKRNGDLGAAGSGCELKHVAGRNWVLTLKGVPESVHCRGEMPESTLYGILERNRFIDADVKLVAGKWKLSICSYIKRQRSHGSTDTYVEFDLIDGFARVNGKAVWLPEVSAAQVLQDKIDTAKSERDIRWPKRAPSDEEWREANAAISRMERKAARMRKNALHVWTTRLVSNASGVTIVKPPVREKTKSPKGDEKNWGANVSIVSKINRHVLSQAPSMAIAMIFYKAQEAGIRCDIIEDDSTGKLAIGEKLVAAGKQLRKTKRALEKAA